mmetsp:Transcript_70219/g.117158  ORF Transcript_70219/g.117158 Transcript_70219/m.117158 type:complete len:125 (+) Transcript_70219:1341-1715(+)
MAAMAAVTKAQAAAKGPNVGACAAASETAATGYRALFSSPSEISLLGVAPTADNSGRVNPVFMNAGATATEADGRTVVKDPALNREAPSCAVEDSPKSTVSARAEVATATAVHDLSPLVWDMLQ